MKKFFIINTPELPSQWTHIFHCRKFAKGFEQNGFKVIEINTTKQFHDCEPCKSDFTYISNSGVNPQHSPNLAESIKAFNDITKYDCVHILWYFHDLISSGLLNHVKRWILTGEKFYSKPSTPWHVGAWSMQNTMQNYVPLAFASALSPDEIGKFTRPEAHLASFAGSAYKKVWCERLRQIRDVEIRFAPPFFDDETRIKIFCNSVTCLGFHHEANIQNSVITERVFEGLSLGNIVVSDNPICVDVTDGIVSFVPTFEDLLCEIDRYWNDKQARKQKQELGMKWAVSHGTYKSVAMQFIEVANKI